MPINSIALVLDGSGNHYFACGHNEYGQLGTGDDLNKVKFFRVDLPEKFCSLSPGLNHSLGISESDRSLWSWGSNKEGQLGQGQDVAMLIHQTNKNSQHTFLCTNFCWR